MRLSRKKVIECKTVCVEYTLSFQQLRGLICQDWSELFHGRITPSPGEFLSSCSDLQVYPLKFKCHNKDLGSSQGVVPKRLPLL